LCFYIYKDVRHCVPWQEEEERRSEERRKRKEGEKTKKKGGACRHLHMTSRTP
jgi:hypothetical protein